MVLDSGRTIIIWAVSLALSWQAFYPLQIVGFILLVIGKFQRILYIQNMCGIFFSRYGYL